jgi:hypothetical protein
MVRFDYRSQQIPSVAVPIRYLAMLRADRLLTLSRRDCASAWVRTMRVSGCVDTQYLQTEHSAGIATEQLK